MMPLDEETLNMLIGEYLSAYGGEIDISLETIDKSSFTVHFSGRLCRACGIEEYFDGFVYMLRLSGINASVENVKEERGGYTVTYRINE